jgi:hypothetical protein
LEEKEEPMKTILLVLAVSTSLASAQTPSVTKTACGPAGTHIPATASESNQETMKPVPGKGMLYLLMDDGISGNNQHYTVKMGVDGAWVGAYRVNSYIAVSLDPGEHHLCANVQSASSWGRIVALAHLKVVPGETYYFRTTFLAGLNSQYASAPFLSFEPLDSDEGKYLIETLPRADASGH